MYKFDKNHQFGLADFNQPMGLKMNPENRWVKKAEKIPWEAIEEKYAALFPGKKGMPAKPLRTALGSLLIQKQLQFSDRELVEEIRENPYFQYFIGLPGYQDTIPFVPSLLVEFRKRLTAEVLEEIDLCDDLSKQLATIRTLVEQQQYMYENKVHSVPDRIVSISQPYIRPIARGKAKAPVEFGAKLDLSIDENGIARLERLSLNVVLTSFIINLGLSNIYSIDDLTVQRKFCDGTIICELLKPINYRIYLLADTVGNILFKLLFNLIPCSAIMIIVYRNYFIFCINSCSLCVFFLSIILGFMVLWEISSIVQMLCFWIVNVWSISTIKDVFINVLAGTILPVWYLPEAIQNIIKYTPFAAIYITPLKIYLNQMGTKQQIEALLMQLIWIIILALFGNLLWHMGKKKLVVQGG